MDVRTKGYVVAQYDSASICIKIRGRGETSPEAKAMTNAPAEALFSTLHEFGIHKTQLKTSFSIKERRNYSTEKREEEFRGYTATLHVTVSIKDLSKLAKLQDSLTSINGTEVEAPILRISPENKEKYQKEAFKLAYEKAVRRFNYQCQVIGLDPDAYKITNFNVNYDHNLKEDVGGELDLGASAQLFHAGAALVRVQLTLYYHPKNQEKSLKEKLLKALQERN